MDPRFVARKKGGHRLVKSSLQQCNLLQYLMTASILNSFDTMKCNANIGTLLVIDPPSLEQMMSSTHIFSKTKVWMGKYL
jgi:hypothetical protein